MYCTILYCTVLYRTVLLCTVLYCTVLYHTIPYYNTLYHTIPYYTILSADARDEAEGGAETARRSSASATPGCRGQSSSPAAGRVISRYGRGNAIHISSVVSVQYEDSSDVFPDSCLLQFQLCICVYTYISISLYIYTYR